MKFETKIMSTEQGDMPVTRMSDGKSESFWINGAAVAASPLDDTLPSDGILVCDNFQDGKSKAPYNLQVRNTAGDPVSFIAIVREAPYEKIPSLSEGDYDLEITKDGVGYTYTFKGKLEGYASIVITGGLVSPVGVGKTDESPELYISA